NRGRVEQMGPPQELYERPSSSFVAEFLGSVNVLRGQGLDLAALRESGMAVPTADEAGSDGPLSVYIRPHDLNVTRERNGHACWPGQVCRMVPLGGHARLEVRLRDGSELR